MGDSTGLHSCQLTHVSSRADVLFLYYRLTGVREVSIWTQTYVHVLEPFIQVAEGF